MYNVLLTIQCTVIKIHSKSICYNAFGNQMRVWMWYFEEGSMIDGLPTCRYSLSRPQILLPVPHGQGCTWQGLCGVVEGIPA